jgi:hypothetical protein
MRQKTQELRSVAASRINIAVEMTGNNSELGYIFFTRIIDFEVTLVKR